MSADPLVESDGSDPAAGAKRARIIRAAREVCAESGYDGARMEAIATAACVSKGTLYNFFENKQDLFLATVLDSYTEPEGPLREPPDLREGDPSALLEAWMEGLVRGLPAVTDTMSVNYQVWGVVVRDETARRRFFEALRAIYAERSDVLARLIRAGVARREFPEDLDVEAWVDTVSATFDGFVYRSTFDPAHADPERLRAVLRALLAPLLASRPASGADGTGATHG